MQFSLMNVATSFLNDPLRSAPIHFILIVLLLRVSDSFSVFCTKCSNVSDNLPHRLYSSRRDQHVPKLSFQHHTLPPRFDPPVIPRLSYGVDPINRCCNPRRAKGTTWTNVTVANLSRLQPVPSTSSQSTLWPVACTTGGSKFHP